MRILDFLFGKRKDDIKHSDERSTATMATKANSSQEISEKKEEVKESQTAKRINPARPEGLRITRDAMKIEYKAYYQCTEFPIKMQIAKARGYITPPYMYGDTSYLNLLCKDDCIFCHCPFYDRMLLDEMRHNHRMDYDEWVMEYFKNFK